MTPRLDLGKVIAGAFLVPWWHRRAFVRALALPLGLIVGHWLFWYYVAVPNLPQSLLWLAYFVYGLLFTLFAVTCHRLVLLDAEAIARHWLPRWGWRETRFLSWIVGLYAIAFLASWMLLLVGANLWHWVLGDLSAWVGWIQWIMKMPMLYVLGRLCLVFPATALERRPTLRWSWNLTRGQGWRMMVVVGGLPFALSVLVELLYRDGATTAEWLALGVVTVALFAVEIAAVSLSYRELIRNEDPGGADQLSTTATT